jgi:hypothetical protein
MLMGVGLQQVHKTPRRWKDATRRDRGGSRKARMHSFTVAVRVRNRPTEILILAKAAGPPTAYFHIPLIVN